jgi:adenosine deaminase
MVSPSAPAGLADCHLHFEGSLPAAQVAELARRAGHPFADPKAFETARRALRGSDDFLRLFAEVCRLFRRPEDYLEAARAIGNFLADDGVARAEVYVSPEVFALLGLDGAECLRAIDEGFRQAGEARGIHCAILLDAVRHWGPESAERVLDAYERLRLPSIVGFGIGGDEKAVPAAAFSGVYLRARALGLHTSIHTGEWEGAAAVREALDALRPDRLDHGISAVEDPKLLARLAEEDTILYVSPTSNLRTGAVPDPARHPLKRLLDAGVRVALSADDPALFSTTTSGEYRFAREALGLDERDLKRLAENAWHGAFCSREERAAGLKKLEISH